MIPIDYYTDTWSVMSSLKKVMMKHAENKTDTKALHVVKSWNLGFVFPETIRPAVSVFPLSKVFLGMDGQRRETVEYRFSIDIHSAQYSDLEKAKQFVLDCMNDIQQGIKKYLHLKGKNQFLNAFSVTVENQIIYEGQDSRDRGLSSTASIQVLVRAYHEVNSNRIRVAKYKETDYNNFFNEVVSHIKKGCQEENVDVKLWVTKVSKPITRFPAVAILPGNEAILEQRSNLVAVMDRPLQFHVISRGVPKTQLLKENILLADQLVSVIEKYYMVGGYATEGRISQIEYTTEEEGFVFSSVIDADYMSKITFQIEYE